MADSLMAKATLERPDVSVPTLRFTVMGIPQPKGSTKAFGRVVPGMTNRRGGPLVRTAVTSDNPQVKAWQGAIAKAAWCAQQALPREKRAVLLGAVKLEIAFYLRRPTSGKRGEIPHITKPDLDKLLRAAKDGMTETVWADDAQVTEVYAMKRYAEAPGRERAEITVAPVDPPLFAEVAQA